MTHGKGCGRSPCLCTRKRSRRRASVAARLGCRAMRGDSAREAASALSKVDENSLLYETQRLAKGSQRVGLVIPPAPDVLAAAIEVDPAYQVSPPPSKVATLT